VALTAAVAAGGHGPGDRGRGGGPAGPRERIRMPMTVRFQILIRRQAPFVFQIALNGGKCNGKLRYEFR